MTETHSNRGKEGPAAAGGPPHPGGRSEDRGLSPSPAGAQRTNVVFEAGSDMVYGVDLEGRFLWVNSAAEHLTGYPAAELVGTLFQQLIAPEHLEMALRQRDRKLHEGETATRCCIDLIRRDGEREPVEISSWMVGPASAPSGFEGIVSARPMKPADQARQQHRMTMEVVGQLAAGIAHDFNNMLLVVHGYGMLLLERPDLSPDVRHMISEIMQAGRKAGLLTQQLLSLARREPAPAERVELNTALHESEWLLRRLVPDSVKLDLSPAPQPLQVEVEPGQIEQMLLNLVLNARDALGGTGSIRVELTRCGRGRGAMACISVQDTGPGIPPEYLDQIWNPFFTTRQAENGAGLGLANVRACVERAGGHVEVENHPGQGARFSLFLPLVTPDQPACVEASVLLVEREDAVRQIMQRVMEREGWRVTPAVTAEDALRAAATAPFLNTLVASSRLSGGDIEKLEERLRPQFPDLCVVAVSGGPDLHPSHHPKERWRSLRKPFSPQSLVETIRQLLHENRDSRERPAGER